MNKKTFPFFQQFHLILVLFFYTTSAQAEQATITYTPINIIGDEKAHGIFDPSIEYGDDTIGWMSYTRVHAPKYIDTRLAKTPDQGKSWYFVDIINPSYDDKNYPQKIWRSETSSLVYDPKDSADKRWKLFTHKYPINSPYKPTDRQFNEGWVEYQTAASPDKQWSKPQCLFGSKTNHCRITPNALSPELKDYVFFNEIGTLYHNNTLYLSLDAGTSNNGLGQWDNFATLLFASHDHGKNWRFLGKLTDSEDAAHLGYLVLTGASLIEHKGTPYLLITPSGKKGFWIKNRGHDGSYLIPFSDINKAQLKRDTEGKLIINKKLLPTLTTGGLSDYHEKNINGGIVFSQTDKTSLENHFQIHSSNVFIAK